MQRLASVLEVVYLIFNEGYAATGGADWMRPALSEEALRLGRVLTGLLPDESEVQGLVALMEIQASRFPARISASGEPILLLDQDRKRWDRLLIRRGLDALSKAEALPGPLGPYALQAAIAACHARAVSVEQTDWARIAAIYDALAQIAPSSIVQSPSAWPSARRPGWKLSTACWPSPISATITCCPACAATCWSAWTGTPKPAPSSNVPPA